MLLRDLLCRLNELVGPVPALFRCSGRYLRSIDALLDQNLKEKNVKLIRTTRLWPLLAAAIVFCALPVELNAALVLHLTGNGSAADASGNGRNGTLMGDTTFAPGILGDAFQFDGLGDYVAIANDPALEPTSALSVAAWVSMGSVQGRVLIADSSHGFIDFSGWSLQTDLDGRIGFAFGNGNAFPELLSVGEIDDAQFHHIAGVFDGASLSIYVDGVLEGQLAYSGVPLPSGRELRIGASWGGVEGGAIREVNGLIDDVRIYNHALTAGEVQLLSAVPEPGSLSLLALIGAGCLSFRRVRPAFA